MKTRLTSFCFSSKVTCSSKITLFVQLNRISNISFINRWKWKMLINITECSVVSWINSHRCISFWSINMRQSCFFFLITNHFCWHYITISTRILYFLDWIVIRPVQTGEQFSPLFRLRSNQTADIFGAPHDIYRCIKWGKLTEYSYSYLIYASMSH